MEGGLRSVDDIRELRLHAGQQTFRLGDIAEVRQGLEDPPSARTRYQGGEAVVLGTTMAPGANVTVVGADVDRALKRIEQGLPIGIELGRISDQAEVVTNAVHEFLEAFGEAVGIVLLVSLIALGWRAGLVVALTIPLVLTATVFVMSLIGIDLHRISLGAMVIALGLLVDDAMISVEMMDRKLKEGHDRLAAATFAYTSTAFPMLTGTLITVAGFIPVGFARSAAGEYVSSLFWVTGISLIISWFAAVYFTPWIGYWVLKAHNRRRRRARRLQQPVLPHNSSHRCLVRPPASAGRRADRRRVVGEHRKLRLHPKAVLPNVQPFRNPRRPVVAGRHLVRGNRARGQAFRTGDFEKPRSRLCHDIHRRRRAALLPAARSAAREPELRPAHADVQVDRSARASAGSSPRNSGARLPGSPQQGRTALQRSSGGVARPNPRDRAGSKRSAPPVEPISPR